eukprot:224006_1
MVPIDQNEKIVVSLLLRPSLRLHYVMQASHVYKVLSDEAILHNLLSLNHLNELNTKLGYRYLLNHRMIENEKDLSDTDFEDWFDQVDVEEYISGAEEYNLDDNNDNNKNKKKKVTKIDNKTKITKKK